MNLMQRIAQKLGNYSQRKSGEEFLFGCPKCHHTKLEINPGKKLFHCFRCAYKGTLSQLLKDLNITPFSTIAVASIKKPINIEAQEYEIPGFHAYRADGTQGMDATLHHFLLSRNIESGSSLLVSRQWGYSTDKQFQRRLIVPIIEGGVIVSFIARAQDKSEPKELSGPNRSWFLYNLDYVKKDEPVVLVEGIFDAEAVMRTGLTGVAIMGSNISDTQIGKLLSKNPYPIILMFDGDKAGAEGTVKAYRKLLKRTHTPIKDVSLTDDIDPDEIPTEQLAELIRAVWRSV